MADTFTTEQLHQQAQGNAAIIPLVTIAYFREHGLSVDDWTTFVGQRFAASWSPLQGAEPQAVARAAALNVVSSGARLISITGGADTGEAVLADWPDQEFLALLGCTVADADAFLDVFAPIAEYLHLRFAARREGEQLHLTFTR
jgi:hypothetical protein